MYAEVRKSSTTEMIVYRNGIPEQVIREFTPEQRQQHFIWDELIKRMAGLYPKLLLPVIREIFGKEYLEDVGIEFLSTEYSLDTINEDGSHIMHSVFADMVFRIGDIDIYHMECQIAPEAEMVVRMYEYDTQMAVIHGVKSYPNRKGYALEMPRSVILYLTHTGNTPDVETMEVNFPNGERWTYEVPAMKVQEYSLEKIRERKLFFLIPLTIVRFSDKMKNKKRDFGEETLTDFLKKCILIVAEAVRKGYLSEKEGKDIMDFLDRGCRYLFSGNWETIKEVQSVMEPFFKLGREIFEEEVTERVTQEVTERVTEQVTQQVTQEVTEDVTEQNMRAVIKVECEEGKSEPEIVRKICRVFEIDEAVAGEKVRRYLAN